MRAFFCLLVIVGFLCGSGFSASAQSKTPKEIQAALTEQGYSLGSVDGIWGKKSTEALKAFQSQKGLSVTGVINSVTLEALFPAKEVQPVAGTSAPPTVSGDQAATKKDRLQVIEPKPTLNSQPLQSSGDWKEPGRNVVRLPENTAETNGGFKVFLALCAIAAFWAWARKRRHKMAGLNDVDPQFSAAASLRTEPMMKKAKVNANYNDELVMVIEPSERQNSSPEILSPSAIDLHNRRVHEWVNKNVLNGTSSKVDDRRLRTAETIVPRVANWVRPGTAVQVGPFKITNGMFYFGKYLPKNGQRYEQENCLVDPSHQIANIGDAFGETMGYWPSYEYMSPSARHSYLAWLASDRSDPDTYIGYVFLYFYGLERRLLLDDDNADFDIVADEVHRLLNVFGSNHSFRRYASDLLTVVEIKSGRKFDTVSSALQTNGYEVPTAIKISLGLRVRDGLPFEPDLLLRFAMSHPETRVRTPAKRAFQELALLYAQEINRLFPNGYVLKPGRTKSLKKRYQACSGTFSCDIDIGGGKIPDVSDRAEPITTARDVLEKCTEALDDYSRALGRIADQKPNLLAASKLPDAIRRQMALTIEGRPLDLIEALALKQEPTTIKALAETVGVDVGSTVSKAKLRELSAVCASFGFGISCDPGFTSKTGTLTDEVLVFSQINDRLSEASTAYRARQLSVMLGMIVAFSDGHFHQREHALLIEQVEKDVNIQEDECCRLAAEIRLAERNPSRLDDWLKRLKDIPEASKNAVAEELIATASADGSLHKEEVRKLELIFKRMGISSNELYAQLHDGTSTNVHSSRESKSAVADAPSRGIDLNRLQRIRAETTITSNVLSDIFEEEEITENDISTSDTKQISELFEGLEHRYGTLLSELSQKSSWSAADFEVLIRQAGMLPGAAKEALNEWSLDTFDELIIEGTDPVLINVDVLPSGN